MISFRETVVFVQDVPTSRAFYQDVLDQSVVEDGGNVVFFENQLIIHDAAAVTTMIFGEASPRSALPQGRGNLLIRFETDDLEQAYRKVVDSGAAIVHPITEQAWGQRSFCFLDPDGHLIEIGEPTNLAFGEA
jgi:catechol 2,3-dioxygenase-like lactoylglutathione lyase family enzyme